MFRTFAGAKGEMAARIAAADWVASPVGPRERWPHSLRTAVSLLLESECPMLLCWGSEFIQFYNDPFRQTLGAGKHPAIGMSARVTFREVWPIVGPLFDRVMTGEAVGCQDMLVPLDRRGFLEECYFTYSYSPFRAEGGEVAGVFVTCTETTGRVVGDRRLRLLRELAAESTAPEPDAVCRRAAEVLARRTADLPFALLYLRDEERSVLRYVAGSGLPDHAIGPRLVSLSGGATTTWPLERALAAGALIVDEEPSAPYRPAFVAPIFRSPGIAAGVLVAGASPQLPLDDQYCGFVTLVAREIGASLAHAQTQQPERQHALGSDPGTRDIPMVLRSAPPGAGENIRPHDRQLAELFQHAPVAVALLRGADHVFDFANSEYMAVVGRGDLAGRRIVDALPELAEQGLVALLDEAYRSGKPYCAHSVPLRLNRGERGASEQAYFNFAYQPRRNYQGDVEGIAVVAVEVTAVIEARSEADAANMAKDNFLAVLGHELRTPLAPMLAAVRLLELNGSPDAHTQKLRATIGRQARHMQRLIEDLFDVGRIVSGKMRLEKDRVDLATLVEQAVEAASPAIERRHHALTIVMPDDPVYVDADAARFTQVLWNLLNNAAKFMPDGGRIELSVKAAGGAAIVRVRDYGVGIAHDMLERVFDRFVQAPRGGERSEGLGIGLAVAKTIVELHGGTIVARSDGPGLGSDFTVIVPVAHAGVSSIDTSPAG